MTDTIDLSTQRAERSLNEPNWRGIEKKPNMINDLGIGFTYGGGKKKTSTQSDRVMLGPGIPFKRLKVMNLRKAGISRSKQDIIYN